MVPMKVIAEALEGLILLRTHGKEWTLLQAASAYHAASAQQMPNSINTKNLNYNPRDRLLSAMEGH